MKIERKDIDDLTFKLTVEIDKADAQEKKSKALKEYRRKADLKGFRKGMVPMSIIEKMYGVSALAESVNTLISDSLNSYIKEQKLNLLGEPVPDEEGQPEIDWSKDEKFTFKFDLATAPKVEVDVTKSDKVPVYNVAIAEADKKEYKEGILKQFGKLVPSDEVHDEDFLIVDLQQGDKKIEGTYISMKTLEDKPSRKKMLGLKAGDKVELNVVKAFPNETDRAALLKVKKEELENSDPKFEVTVKEVKKFQEAEQNQDLYDRVFGKGVVKDEKDFEKKVEERLGVEYKQESDLQFRKDAIDYLLKKADIKLPEEFLKKWLYRINEGKFTMEQIEKDFDLFLKDFRWQMIRESIIKSHKLEVGKDAIMEEAKNLARYRFAMYGINDVPEEQLNNFAGSLLSDEKESRNVYEKAEEGIVLDYVRKNATLGERKISIKELRNLNQAGK